MQVVYAVSTNSGNFNQGFSQELYGIQMQHTAANFQPRTPSYDLSPPPYDPTWAPKERKPDCQNAFVANQNIQTHIEKATGAEEPNTHGEGYIYDNLTADRSDDHYRTLEDVALNDNQRTDYAHH